MPFDQPWKPPLATSEIRKLARDEQLPMTYTMHIRERLAERDLTTGDVLYVLKHGFVYEDPEPSTRPGYYKYRIESRSPNSGSRTIRVVVIPDANNCQMKLVTVMYVDES
ncbi:DUF4258 domain-containing protein [Methylobacterium sp. Leaf88]|uniref:DUF4258 domain-containing protein n=1 Tax=Methylobacterium sp. Leaf88 TaxID=1736244 RepID=UPI0006FE3785|nr:DUF4258 domain-containing protein [Methylobacterium sp. Leaf88]KQO76409.1 hypothetical protein ASF20_13755 [Methylobacterium sp. Leaf88]